MEHGMKTQKAFTWIELIVAIGIILILLALLFPAIYSARMIGDPRLTQPPDEARRFFHPNGMSMVRPEDWQVFIDDMGPKRERLTFQASGKASNFYYEISVTAVKTTESEQIPPEMQDMINPADFTATTFQGQKAFEHIGHVPTIRRRVPNLVFGKLYFFRNEYCCLLTYTFHNRKYEVPKNLPLYLESFQIPERLNQSVPSPTAASITTGE